MHSAEHTSLKGLWPMRHATSARRRAAERLRLRPVPRMASRSIPRQVATSSSSASTELSITVRAWACVRRLALYSALAEDFFSQFGNGAANKKLPDWVFFAERRKQLELLRGEWQGDGRRVNQARQKYLNITTPSKVLAFQIQAKLEDFNLHSA